MGNKTKPNNKNFLSLLIIILAIVFVFYLATNKTADNQISYTKFVEMVNNGEVSDVHFQGGIAKVRISDSKIEKENFPAYYDYYFQYITANPIDKVEEFNDKVNLAKSYEPNEVPDELKPYVEFAVIEMNMASPKTPLINQVLPYLGIIASVIVMFLIYKVLTGKAGGATNFGKSRARIEKSNVKFSDIAGAEEEKEETKEIVEFLKNPARFKQLGARIPKGVLLVGPPGTGKTLLAKAVAGESNVPFFNISGSDFVELYIGVGASRVRDLFETAKRNAPCIVFIDEIDAVGRQRGAGLGGGNDEREQTLNQLLVEMDGFESNNGIIVLAATNRADILDPALLRPGRFDRQIYVNIPDVKGREGIIKIHAKNKPIDSSVDFKTIARLTSGFTGADIENFLNEAAILAARDGRLTITMEDITEGINKVIMGPQKKSRLITEKDKKITAYHESGHAIIAKLLDTGENVHEVSIIPRGMAGGYTSTRPNDDDEHFTYTKLNNKLCMIMGGRVAEELVFGDITAGAASDISRATEIARKMVTEWGMSKKLGFINFGKGTEIFIGRDYQTTKSYSENTASIIDQEIKEILDENYKRAKEILSNNRSILDNMSNLLLEKETIYSDEVDKIMKGADYKEVAKELEKKERQRKRKEAKKRKEAEEAKAKQLQELKLKAAEALNSAGVITKQELQIIKEENLKLTEKFNKEKSPKKTKKSTQKQNDENQTQQKNEDKN